MVGRRLGAGLLRLGGVALSLGAYSYLELLPLRPQQAYAAAGERLSSLIVGTLGEYNPKLGAVEWGQGVPPMLKRWVCLVGWGCM